jgi:hypothetical protein
MEPETRKSGIQSRWPRRLLLLWVLLVGLATAVTCFMVTRPSPLIQGGMTLEAVKAILGSKCSRPPEAVPLFVTDDDEEMPTARDIWLAWSDGPHKVYVWLSPPPDGHHASGSKVMTEAEWLACTNPRPMLDFLCGKASDRKLWLFSCTCCRLIWHLPPEPCYRLVAAVEQYADQEANPRAMVALFDGYYPGEVELRDLPGGSQAAGAAGQLGWQWRWDAGLCEYDFWDRSRSVARSAAEALAKSMPWRQARQLEGQLLHDLFGPRLYRPLPFQPRWWARTVCNLAESIYRERAFHRLPILGDALEQAGCDDAQVLAHCRQPGEHVRGCWVVDQILRKEPKPMLHWVYDWFQGKL